AANTFDGTVSVVDTTNDTQIGTLGALLPPRQVALHPNGTRAYVTGCCDPHQRSVVNVLDTTTNAVVATIPLPGFVRATGGIAVNPAGTRVYVTTTDTCYHCYASDVRVIDTATNTVMATVYLPAYAAPGQIAVHPDGSRVYFTFNNWGSFTSAVW